MVQNVKAVEVSRRAVGEERVRGNSGGTARHLIVEGSEESSSGQRDVCSRRVLSIDRRLGDWERGESEEGEEGLVVAKKHASDGGRAQPSWPDTRLGNKPRAPLARL